MGSGLAAAASNSARPPPSEPVKPREWMLYHGKTHLVRPPVHQRENTFRHARVTHRFGDGARGQLRRSRMTGMCLAHDRTAGGERRCGVTTRHGKGEREIAGAEHGDWPERLEHAPHVWPGQRRARRVAGIDARFHPRSLFYAIGEQPKLIHRP